MKCKYVYFGGRYLEKGTTYKNIKSFCDGNNEYCIGKHALQTKNIYYGK